MLLLINFNRDWRTIFYHCYSFLPILTKNPNLWRINITSLVQTISTIFWIFRLLKRVFWWPQTSLNTAGAAAFALAAASAVRKLFRGKTIKQFCLIHGYCILSPHTQHTFLKTTKAIFRVFRIRVKKAVLVELFSWLFIFWISHQPNSNCVYIHGSVEWDRTSVTVLPVYRYQGHCFRHKKSTVLVQIMKLKGILTNI